MTDYEAIYRDHAEAYDRMVRAEDCDGQLGRALDELGLRAREVVEIGVGTGRVTELLLERKCRVHGIERAPAMLAIARDRLSAYPGCVLEEGDARELPVGDDAVDAAVAGWVLGHMTHWEAARWRQQIGRAVTEMRRVVRSGGRVVIIETLGSGQIEAAPPNPTLADYYAWLENDHGFSRRVIRTDYAFADVDQAVEATTFFFGEAFGARVRDNGWSRIPEHTGIWFLTQPA